MARIGKFERVSEDEYRRSCRKGVAYSDILVPKRATSGSAGYDFYAPFEFTLEPGETIAFATCIRCLISPGWFLMITPRSGLGFKYRCQLDNTVGIIDSDYYASDNEGNIHMRITNDGHKSMRVEKGEGIAQGIFLQYGITVDDRADGTRNGGFGSTDKN